MKFYYIKNRDARLLHQVKIPKLELLPTRSFELNRTTQTCQSQSVLHTLSFQCVCLCKSSLAQAQYYVKEALY